MMLGCIADDFTGATDLANNLVRAGMRCLLINGVPDSKASAALDADAVVIALKSRTIAAQAAIEQSLAAMQWLKQGGARQIYFKICSTFDSTDRGNIGPVTEALMHALGSDFAIACPAFPENKRTIFKGYLFAGDVLLNESGMQNHPLTPMTDANLVRVMQRQCRSKVGLIDYATVAQGTEAISRRIEQLRGEGVRIAIVDAISNADLMAIGPAIAQLPVVTAGSGIAIGLPQNFGLQPSPRASALPATEGRFAIVSGSCSTATQGQVAAHIAAGQPALQIDASRLHDGAPVVAQALQWFGEQAGDTVSLFYSTADAAAVQSVQKQLGVERSGKLIEDALAAIAQGLIDRGVRKLIVAGGETAGAVVQALGINELRIGPQIDPGVPWCATRLTKPAASGPSAAGASSAASGTSAASGSSANGQTLWLALKSGNFGAADFFLRAWATV